MVYKIVNIDRIYWYIFKYQFSYLLLDYNDDCYGVKVVEDGGPQIPGPTTQNSGLKFPLWISFPVKIKSQYYHTSVPLTSNTKAFTFIKNTTFGFRLFNKKNLETRKLQTLFEPILSSK